MLESLFELLFRYRPVVFQRGEFVFAAPWPVLMVVLCAFAVAVPVVWAYTRVGGPVGRRDRLVLVGLRVAVLGVLLFCLLRPSLRLATAVPQQNFVAVLIDDSRSMRIADEGGEPRGAFVAKNFGDTSAPLVSALAERFQLRFFRFAAEVERVADVAELSYAGTRTDLGRALERVRQEMAGLPLSGVVVVSDGADNSRASLAAPLVGLRAAGVPVFTVGVGREALARDIQVSRVEPPRSVTRGTSLVVNVAVSQRGFRGKRIPLQVEEEGRIIALEEIELPGDGETVVVPVHFEASEPGPRRLRFRVPPQEGEVVGENNAREALIEVEDRVDKILYFEGEPRFEVKFIRRAVAEDENLQVVVLQRTAENKFLRLDVDSGEELASGFPKTREELFRYRGLILGSVEASFFTHEQLQMIAEFVERRKGGLLMLGGRRAFGEGGWAGTPVAAVLPVELEEDGGERGFFAEVQVRPTREGVEHAALRLAATRRETEERWRQLPALTTVNRIRGVKPGATVLLAGTGEGIRGEQPILAYQRYGQGKAMAFAVQDSWLWQMHATIPLEDLTHETLWRRLLRWLVSDVPGPVTVVPARDRLAPEERAVLVATVADSSYRAVNDAEVVARVEEPGGRTLELPMEWAVDRDGEYRAGFLPEAEGVYRVTVEARRRGSLLGTDVAYLEVAPVLDEYFDAGMRASLLERIAEETGGRFYTAATVGSLPEDIQYTGKGTTVVEEKDLWDMPALFLLLVALLGAEWGYRRARGLA